MPNHPDCEQAALRNRKGKEAPLGNRRDTQMGTDSQGEQDSQSKHNTIITGKWTTIKLEIPSRPESFATILCLLGSVKSTDSRHM